MRIAPHADPFSPGLFLISVPIPTEILLTEFLVHPGIGLFHQLLVDVPTADLHRGNRHAVSVGIIGFHVHRFTCDHGTGSLLGFVAEYLAFSRGIDAVEAYFDLPRPRSRRLHQLLLLGRKKRAQDESSVLANSWASLYYSLVRWTKMSVIAF